MRQAIRALGWATNILWVMIIVFSVTLLYSVMNVFPNVSFGEPRFLSSNGVVVMSLPFSINNTGYYDISELNITTYVMDHKGAEISTSTTLVRSIPQGSSIDESHNVSIKVNDMIERGLSYLLFNDSVFNMSMLIALKFAHIIPIQVSTEGTMPWGAPLYNFFIGEISYNLYNLTHYKVVIPLSFENHSFFSLNGTILFEVYNGQNERLGSGVTSVNVPSNTRCKDLVEVIVRGDPREITEARVYLDTSLFSFGPVVMRRD